MGTLGAVRLLQRQRTRDAIMTVGVPKTPCASAGMKIDDGVPLARGRVPPHHIQKEPKRGSGVPPLLSPHRIVYFHTVVYTPIFWYCPGRKLLTSGLLRLRALTAGRSTCCVHYLSVYFFRYIFVPLQWMGAQSSQFLEAATPRSSLKLMVKIMAFLYLLEA